MLCKCMRFLNFHNLYIYLLSRVVHSKVLPRFVPVVLVIISCMVKILSNIILIPIVFLCEISSMHFTSQ